MEVGFYCELRQTVSRGCRLTGLGRRSMHCCSSVHPILPPAGLSRRLQVARGFRETSLASPSTRLQRRRFRGCTIGVCTHAAQDHERHCDAQGLYFRPLLHRHRHPGIRIPVSPHAHPNHVTARLTQKLQILCPNHHPHLHHRRHPHPAPLRPSLGLRFRSLSPRSVGERPPAAPFPLRPPPAHTGNCRLQHPALRAQSRRSALCGGLPHRSGHLDRAPCPCLLVREFVPRLPGTC